MKVLDGQRKGTEDHTEEGSATQATQTPTSIIFGDDETIAMVLLNMIKAKNIKMRYLKFLIEYLRRFDGYFKPQNDEDDFGIHSRNGI
ncbi:hypothetical protein Tco_0418720 [Tanacetum coccineum]